MKLPQHGKNARNTYEDTTSVAYTMPYKDEYKNDIEMSWFRESYKRSGSRLHAWSLVKATSYCREA